MLQLHREASPSAWSREQYESLFRTTAAEETGYFMLVVETLSESRGVAESALPSLVVAHLVAQQVLDEWHLQYIVVAKRCQRRGVGTRLLKEFISFVKKTDGSRILLEVRESNESARRLYHQLGFQEMGLRRNYYPDPLEDAIHYQLRL